MLNAKLLIALAALVIGAPVVATSSDVTCLANIIHQEARGESIKGQEAVAYVVLNRASKSKQTVCTITNARGQFSANHKGYKIPAKSREQFEAVASLAIFQYNRKIDPSHGALFFQQKSIKVPRHAIITTKIGGHVFYTTANENFRST